MASITQENSISQTGTDTAAILYVKKNGKLGIILQHKGKFCLILPATPINTDS